MCLIRCRYLGEDEKLLPEEVFAGFDKFIGTVNQEMTAVSGACTCSPEVYFETHCEPIQWMV